MSLYTPSNHRACCIPAICPEGLCEAAAEGDAGKGMFTGYPGRLTRPTSHYISGGPIANEFGDCRSLRFDEEGAP